MKTAKLMTAEDLWALPKNGLRHELVRGELRTMPPAGGEHGVTTINLAWPMGAHADRNDLGKVLAAETGFILSRDPDVVRAADIAFVAKARIPATGIPKGFWPGAPDLAVETVSPSDTMEDVDEKVDDWLNAGTKMVWVVNPKRRTVTVYRSRDHAHILYEKDELDGQDVLPGFKIAVSKIFA